MTPAERTAKIAQLRAEADRLEREGVALRPALEAGQIWRHPEHGDALLASREPLSGTRLCMVMLDTAQVESDGIVQFEDTWDFLGHASDLLTIKVPDAPEPTGAELVGKVCEFSEDGERWVIPGRCAEFLEGEARSYKRESGSHWTHARLYREGRP